MKLCLRMISLLLAVLLLAGCGAAAPSETQAPETVPVQTAEKTEAALAQIRALGD